MLNGTKGFRGSLSTVANICVALHQRGGVEVVKLKLKT